MSAKRGAREGRPVAVGLPGRFGRWSPEQRAAAMQRRRAVRWIYENVIVDQRTLQGAAGRGHNVANDMDATGEPRVRWWWTSADAERTLAHLDGEHRRPCRPPKWGGPRPLASDVTMPEPPALRLYRVRAWLFVNGCESWKALSEYDHHRWGGTGPRVAARQRGTNGWSTTELDWLFPDQTCPPRTRTYRHGVTMSNTAAIRISTDLRDRLAAAADERGVSVSWMVAKLLDESLADLRPAEDIRLTRRAS